MELKEWTSPKAPIRKDEAHTILFLIGVMGHTIPGSHFYAAERPTTYSVLLWQRGSVSEQACGGKRNS